MVRWSLPPPLPPSLAKAVADASANFRADEVRIVFTRQQHLRMALRHFKKALGG